MSKKTTGSLGPGEAQPVRPGGFTLVELLVVIAILGLLAGLLLPTLSGARRTARSMACLSQMRQIGMASVGYSEDHQQMFPRSQHSAFAHGEPVWGRSLAPYLGLATTDWTELLNGIYHCPDDERVGQFSYGSNVYMEVGPEDDYPGYPQTWRNRSQIPRPSETILFGENNSFADHIMPNFWTSPRDAADCAYDRHGDTANYIFVDGHGESRTFDTIYDPARGIDAWNPLTGAPQ